LVGTGQRSRGLVSVLRPSPRKLGPLSYDDLLHLWQGPRERHGQRGWQKVSRQDVGMGGSDGSRHQRVTTDSLNQPNGPKKQGAQPEPRARV